MKIFVILGKIIYVCKMKTISDEDMYLIICKNRAKRILKGVDEREFLLVDLFDLFDRFSDLDPNDVDLVAKILYKNGIDEFIKSEKHVK